MAKVDLVKQFGPAEFVAKAVDFIRETVSRAGFERVIVGTSGGVDSSTTLLLAVKALGPENVYVLMLPYGEMGKDGVERAKSVIYKAKLPEGNIHLVDIKDKVAPFLSGDMNKIRRGNIMARVRMIVLYDLAKKLNALVAGTENKSEYLLGYFTRFGDEAADLEPIRSLYKTQVYEMAEYLDMPQDILDAEPSAGLWEEQTDESELGFSYAKGDPILHLLCEQKLSENEIVRNGFEERLVENVAKWVRRNEFKHRLPYVLAAEFENPSHNS